MLKRFQIKKRVSLLFLLFFLFSLQFFVSCQSSAGTGQVISNGNNVSSNVSEPIAGNSELTSLSDIGPLMDFSLTDQNGRIVTLADLKGKVWVADFFFTSCNGACPIMTGQMAKLKRNLGASGLHLLSISVDPAVDTVEKLADYAKQFDAKDDWRFVTGEKSKIIELSVKGFRLSADEDPTSHSQRLVLLDRNAHIRGYYHVERENEMKLLEESAAKLLAESK
jgi:protein SCO1